MKRRILLTGSAGGVGTMFRDWAGDRYDFVCFDRNPTPGAPDAVVGDLTDLPALERAAAGCDTLVHLGAYPNPADFLSVIVPNNIVGAYHAYEAAARAKLRRVVFASSLQVEEGYPRGTFVSVDMPARPVNPYAVSKAFGENLGQVYSRRHGLSVICLRFGHVVVPSKEAFLLARAAIPSVVSLTARDGCEIISRAIDVEGVDYAVVDAFSRNAAQIRDLKPLRDILGYEPQDDAYALWGVRK
ncbi:MAG: NAD(P)-dependent oxidoreductase [bacterium]